MLAELHACSGTFRVSLLDVLTHCNPWLSLICTAWDVLTLTVQHRVASRVKTRQAWHAAVRHTGLLFQLPSPASDGSDTITDAATASSSMKSGEGSAAAAAPSRGDFDGAAVLEAVSALPYPQLSQTVSSANFAPAAHLAEHYSPPGGMLSRLTCMVGCSPLGILRADLVSGVHTLAKLSGVL